MNRQSRSTLLLVMDEWPMLDVETKLKIVGIIVRRIIIANHPHIAAVCAKVVSMPQETKRILIIAASLVASAGLIWLASITNWAVSFVLGVLVGLILAVYIYRSR